MKRFIPFVFALTLATVHAQQTPQIPQITVSGSAEVRVVPDEVIINAGVESRDPDLNLARRQNDDHMKTVLAFLKDSGIPAKDVQTDYINIEPDYGDWNRNPSRTPVFFVRKYLEVRLTNVTNVDAILTGMLNAGIDRINNVEFRTTELRKYRDQARTLATRAAKEKADELCAELGVKRGKPLNINATDSGGMWNPYGYFRGGGFNNFASNAQTMVQTSGDPADSSGGTLSLGQVKVTATVNVSFAIE